MGCVAGALRACFRSDGNIIRCIVADTGSLGYEDFVPC